VDRDMTDEELIGRFVRHRDERAFRQLYARHTPAVYGFIRRLVGPAADLADDILQDTWLRATGALPLFRGESAFRTWLIGIALNCYRERRRRQMAANDGGDALPERVGRNVGPALDITDILDSLSDRHREVLALHDIEGYTHEEIAEALGIEVGTSKSRLSRARQLFRERWRSQPVQTGAQR
jgi:RNA polymerase sigma-70 factor (ECF subfamily)